MRTALPHGLVTLLHLCVCKTVAVALLVAALISSLAYAESPYPFVPESFDVPSVFETDQFRLRTLTVNDVVKDFDAVISSAVHISEVWPDSGWPAGLTLEQNLIDLGWHQREFQRRTSFAYTVVALDESRVIGCVYIYPTRKASYDAEVYLWTRPPEQVININAKSLQSAVQGWLAKEWPFKAPAFPGMEIAWSEWHQLSESKR